MVSTFNGNYKTMIISCYIPTNASDETGLITFYNELSSLVRSIPKHQVLIIGGDINLLIDKKTKEIQPTQLVKKKWGTPNGFLT